MTCFITRKLWGKFLFIFFTRKECTVLILFFAPFESRPGPDELLGKYTISLTYDSTFSKISSRTLNTEVRMHLKKSVLQDYRFCEYDLYKKFYNREHICMSSFQHQNIIPQIFKSTSGPNQICGPELKSRSSTRSGAKLLTNFYSTILVIHLASTDSHSEVTF